MFLHSMLQLCRSCWIKEQFWLEKLIWMNLQWGKTHTHTFFKSLGFVTVVNAFTQQGPLLGIV